MPVVNYTTAGSFSWVAPTNVTSVVVEAIASGESGKPGALLTANAGGGSGAASRSRITVVPGTTYTIAIGEAGAAGSMGGNSAPGGDASFAQGSTVLLLAKGGGTTTASQGGQASSGIGQTRLNGGNGSAPPGGGQGGAGGNAPTIGTLVGGAGGNASTSTAGAAPGGGGQGGRADGNGGSAAGGLGAVRLLFTPETNAPAGTTNFATNPSSETSLNATGTSGNVTAGTDGGYAGMRYIRHTSTASGSANRIVQPLTGLTAGQAYTFVWWARTGTSTTASVVLRFESVTSGGTVSGTSATGVSLTSANGWTQLSLTVTIPSTMSTCRIVIQSNLNSGLIIDADALLVLSGSTVYRYFDGDQTNSSWTGTPHASTSRYKVATFTGLKEFNGTSEVTILAKEYTGTAENALLVYEFNGTSEVRIA